VEFVYVETTWEEGYLVYFLSDSLGYLVDGGVSPVYNTVDGLVRFVYFYKTFMTGG
jgi:hypothetical protein